MKKRAKWSRPKKTLRNWALVVMMAVALYMIGDFPALTKRALADEILRDNLMSDGEIIWEETNTYSQERMYILSGDTVVAGSYNWHLLFYSRWESNILYGNGGITCVPSSGVLGEFLAMGNLPEAASAVLELRMRGTRDGETDRVYTVEGVRKTDKVITFTVDEAQDDRELFDRLRRTIYPEGYYDYTLRLYDAAGQEIGVWTDASEQEAQ